MSRLWTVSALFLFGFVASTATSKTIDAIYCPSTFDSEKVINTQLTRRLDAKTFELAGEFELLTHSGNGLIDVNVKTVNPVLVEQSIEKKLLTDGCYQASRDIKLITLTVNN